MSLPALPELFEEKYLSSREVSQIGPSRIQNGIWITLRPKETSNRKIEEKLSLPIIQNSRSNSYNKLHNDFIIDSNIIKHLRNKRFQRRKTHRRYVITNSILNKTFLKNLSFNEQFDYSRSYDQSWKLYKNKSEFEDEDEEKIVNQYQNIDGRHLSVHPERTSFEEGYFCDPLSTASAANSNFNDQKEIPNQSKEEAKKSNYLNSRNPSIVVSGETGYKDFLEIDEISNNSFDEEVDEKTFFKENSFLWKLSGLQDGSRFPKKERDGSATTVYFMGGKDEDKEKVDSTKERKEIIESLEQMFNLQEQDVSIHEALFTNHSLKSFEETSTKYESTNQEKLLQKNLRESQQEDQPSAKLRPSTPEVVSKVVKIKYRSKSNYKRPQISKLVKDDKSLSQLLNSYLFSRPLSANRRRKICQIFETQKDINISLNSIYLGDLTVTAPLVKREVSIEGITETVCQQNVVDKVYIYLSSSGDDTSKERESIRENLVPLLKQFCKSCGFDFKMIDLKPTNNETGLKFTPVSSHLRHQLIREAFNKSIGVSYLSFSGSDEDKDVIFLPDLISDEIYFSISDYLSKEISKNESCLSHYIDKEDGKVLSDFAKSKIKLLESNISKFLNFKKIFVSSYILNSNSNCCYYQLNEDKYNVDKALYKSSSNSTDRQILINIMMQFITSQNTENMSSSSNCWLQKLCKSPRIDELNFILNSCFAGLKKAKSSCLWMIRKTRLEQRRVIENSFLSSTARKLKELQGHFVNDIINKVGYSNLRRYEVSYSVVKEAYTKSQRKVESSKLWRHYLNRIRNDLYFSCVSKIEKEFVESNFQNRNLYLEEVAFHAKVCQDYSRRCIGRRPILTSIKKYLWDSTNRNPLILHGPAASGKTSVLSKAASMIRLWSKNESSEPSRDVVFRSCKLSNNSVCLRKLLVSLCIQMKVISQQKTNISTKHQFLSPNEIHLIENQTLLDVSENFKHLLTLIQSSLIIIIDGIDCSSTLEDYPWKWLPHILPPNIKIIISVSDSSCIDHENHFYLSQFSAIKDYLGRNSNFIPLPPLAEDSSFVSNHIPSNLIFLHSVIDEELAATGRQLTIMQMRLIIETCSYLKSPFEVLLCVYISKDWSSDQSYSSCTKYLTHFGEDVNKSINCFFEYMEDKFGFCIMASTCRLLVATHTSGLTCNELQVLVSYEEQMKGFMKLITNLSKNSQQVPDYVWIPFWKELKATLLVECLSYNLLEYKWKHQFIQIAAKKRYFDCEGILLKECKILLGKYFNNQLVDVNQSNNQLKKKKFCRRIIDSDKENQTCQPLIWQINKDFASNERWKSKKTLNIRRLTKSVPFALFYFNADEMKANILCNYEWLQAKLSATSFEDLMEDVTSACNVFKDDKDLKVLSETLYLSRNILRSDPQQLASQICGRLRSLVKRDRPLARLDPRNYPYIKSLVVQTRHSLTPIFIPSSTCLYEPGDVMYDVINGHKGGILSMSLTSDGDKLITTSKDGSLKFWQLANFKVTKTVRGVGENIIKSVVCMNSKYALLMSETNEISVWCIRSSKRLLLIKEESNDHVLITTAGDSLNLLIVLCSNTKTIKVWCLNKLELLKQHSLQLESSIKDGFVVGRNSNINRFLFSFKNTNTAYIYDTQYMKIVHTLEIKPLSSRVLYVETSLENYVVACARKHMRSHDIIFFELFDTISHKRIRTIQACSGDEISNVLINRLGTHIISFCSTVTGRDIGVWNMENGNHKHIPCANVEPSYGACSDLRYCLIASKQSTSLNVCKLAARIMNGEISRTRVKKIIEGISHFYPLQKNSRYVVARDNEDGPITVWNIQGGRCKGESVSIERGLLEKNDIVVVKGEFVYILSDRALARSHTDDYLQVFTTIYTYNLHTKKYVNKLKSDVSICPRHEYRVLGKRHLLAVSQDRHSFIEWSLENGKITRQIRLDFSFYEKSNKKCDEKPRRNRSQRFKKIGSKYMDRKNTNISSVCENQDEREESISGVIPYNLTNEDCERVIDQFIISEDDSTLVASFFFHYFVVIDLVKGEHTKTLTDKDSLLLLHQAKLSEDGSYLIHSNYDSTNKNAYLTVWCLHQGLVVRRLKNEPGICGLDISTKADDVVFATEDCYLKVWKPFIRGSVRSISGNKDFIQMKKRRSSKNVRIYLIESCNRAVICENDISLVDLQTECIIARFTPDTPILSCIVAMKGNLIVLGIKGYQSAITLRLMYKDRNTSWFLKQSETPEKFESFEKNGTKLTTSSDEEFSEEEEEDTI